MNDYRQYSGDLEELYQEARLREPDNTDERDETDDDRPNSLEETWYIKMPDGKWLGVERFEDEDILEWRNEAGDLYRPEHEQHSLIIENLCDKTRPPMSQEQVDEMDQQLKDGLIAALADPSASESVKEMFRSQGIDV
ncbi:MAG: hypothetical protein JSS66_00105 [Armatimonadetes bacterium]|nr:hypothetical protein [Armatimonadota bacterium]